MKKMKRMKMAGLAAAGKTMLLAVCGVLLMLFPSTGAGTLSYIAGGMIAVWGAVQVLLFFARRDPESDRLAQGALTLCFGLYMILRPALFGELIPSLLTFVMLSFGLRGVQTGVHMQREQAPWTRVQLILSACVSGAAVLLLVIPFADGPLHCLLIGVGYVLTAGAETALCILRRRKKKEKEPTGQSAA